MPVWTGKTRNTNTFTPKSLANLPVSEAFLKINSDNFLLISTGRKLKIQAENIGVIWTPKTRAT